MKQFFENLIYTLYGVIQILFKSKFRPGIIKLDLEKTEQCYILGNGPALVNDIERKADLLHSQTLFVVNFFAKSNLYALYRPGFYIFADPMFYSDHIKHDKQKEVDELLSIISQETSWPIIIFAPNQALEKMRSCFINNKNIQLFDYNIQAVKRGFKWFIQWVHDRQLATFGAMNVVNVAVYLAVFLGFREINLLGIDHSWHLNFVVGKDNLIYQKDRHFDDEKEPDLKLVRKDPGRIKPYKLHELLEYSAIALKNYHYIQAYAQEKNVKIYNCCTDSFVDAFERKN